MIPALLRSLSPLARKWKPLTFCNTNFTRIPPNEKIEEETFPDYVASRYYPAHIGETFEDRYQIVGKLGFGASSTVWLARDLSHRRHVVLKLYVNSNAMGKYLDDEINTYRRMERGSKQHPGYNAVRSLLDSFSVDGPGGQHRCLVHPPLWESVSDFLRRNPALKLPPPVLAFILQRLFLALDFLHGECQIIHTDIKADNIMFGIQDDSVFEVFEEEELQNPSPRKVLTDRTVYASRALRTPKEWGAPVLCDFGSAVSGEGEHLEDIQPDIYRAPEVILQIPWTYSVDIWNVGCMGDWALGCLEYLPGFTVALITFSPVYASVILAIPNLVFNLFNFSFTTPRGGGEDHAGQVMGNVLAPQNTPAGDPDALGTVNRDRQKVNHIDVVYSLVSEALGLRPQDFGVDYDEPWLQGEARFNW
ncbi:hypothetical protein AB5N19_12492 [Seiridium cardinale]